MCAANYHDDGEDYMHQPFNIDKGYIIGGWRHGNVGASYMAANKSITLALDPDTWGHDDYSEEYIENLEDIAAQLRKIKRNL